MDPHSNIAAKPSATMPRRKFVPELIESTTKSSRPTAVPHHGNDQASSKVNTERIRPQLIETTTKSYTKGPSEKNQSKQDGCDGTKGSNFSKRFPPQLIETAKRSFRQNTASSKKQQCRNSATRKRPFGTTSGMESPFSYTNLVRRQETRRHSFRVPDLPAIPSNDSEDSANTPGSCISTPPTSLSNESAQQQGIQLDCPETYPESFPDHLLAVSSRSTAQRLLKDQTLAAFPNEQVHQTVSHFAIDQEDDDTLDEDEEDDIETTFQQMSVNLARFRRASTVDLAWELEEMRRHKEESEMRARERMLVTKQSNFSAAAIAARQAAEEESKPSSPPMLGDDIVFPLCLSPQATRCDTDQTPASHDEEDGKALDDNDIGLWKASIEIDECEGIGLWNGTCQKTNQLKACQLKRPDTGLITPDVYSVDIPFFISPKDNSLINNTQTLSPITPPNNTPPLVHSMDETLAHEEAIKREFHDGFVTQIYNYLSLGYPCLARDFDAELSKITSISVEELQKNDHNVDAKGHIGVPKNSGVADLDGIADGNCMRWSALKLYIHEWARQRPRAAGPDSPVDPWGFRGRRGSWGV